MFRHRIQRVTSFRTYFFWLLSAFIAGQVNTGGYLAAKRFVSHVTGFSTLFGVFAAEGDWASAFGMLSVPAFFLAGVMVSAFFVDRRASLGQRPQYARVMGLMTLLLLGAALGGSLSLFGRFGHEAVIERDYFFLALLCMASGLQNASISSATGMTVRTTHLTGLTTDLGTSLVRAFSDRRQYHAEMRVNLIRLGTIACFALGSAVGAIIYLRMKYWGFLVPAALSLLLTYEALRPTRRLQRLRRRLRPPGR